LHHDRAQRHHVIAQERDVATQLGQQFRVFGVFGLFGARITRVIPRLIPRFGHRFGHRFARRHGRQERHPLPIALFAGQAATPQAHPDGCGGGAQPAGRFPQCAGGLFGSDHPDHPW
jgi:hypothetical protein